MCGIAGIAGKNQLLVNEQRILMATRCLQHRGPEGEAFYINGENTIALGHRRLRVIDLSAEAAQPMHYLNRYHIVHNGELYNYLEIKKELQQQGYLFSTKSDTEVIVAAFAAWGKNCLQKFEGMFAFAIWDEMEKILFAARDRFGEKPFLFYYDHEQFVFASEYKALWSMGIAKEVNGAMLYNFLSTGYTNNPSEPQESFYKDIYKLPAASFLVYTLQSHQIEIENYWKLEIDIDHNIKEDAAIERFQDLFSESIRARLRSDVSIGTSLSGGLDSSSVIAFCSKQPSDHYSHKCFTASFKDFEKDELIFAQQVAKQFGLEHHSITIDENNIPDMMKEVMRCQEEPISSSSPLAQYAVYKAAKENGVTVLLDGQGADEVLGGYHKYYAWFWRELYRKKQLASSGELKAAQALGIHLPFDFKNKIAALMPEFAGSLLQSRKARQAFQNPYLNRDFAFHHKRDLYYSLPSTPDLNGALYFNTVVTGLEELLRLADRNSMAHAIELRLPFLDHKLVEFLFTLPSDFKIHQGWTKWLLRKAVDKTLPDNITWRRDKIGFETPQKKWMEQPSVQEAIREGKKKLINRGILNDAALKKIQQHATHAAENADWKYWSASFLF